MFDTNSRISRINPAGRKLFTVDEPMPGEQLPSGAEYGPLLQVVDKALHSDVSFSEEVMWPDQRLFSAMVTPLQEAGCVIVLQDLATSGMESNHVKEALHA